MVKRKRLRKRLNDEGLTTRWEYIRCPLYIWGKRELAARDKLVLTTILAYLWIGQASPDLKRLAAECGCKEAGVKKAIRCLEESGFVIVNRTEEGEWYESGVKVRCYCTENPALATHADRVLHAIFDDVPPNEPVTYYVGKVAEECGITVEQAREALYRLEADGFIGPVKKGDET